MISIQVYGIPNCGSCQKAFLWLQNHHIEYEFINIKENPPSKNTIANWVETLDSKRMRNTSGQSYRALGESKKTWTSFAEKYG